MLSLMFRIGENRCAIDSHEVLEVLPYLEPETWPGLPPCVPGLIVYRDRPTPVIDLAFYATGKSCPKRWSTRIIMVGRPDRPSDAAGLLVDGLTTNHNPEPLAVGEAASHGHWGTYGRDAQGLFQQVDIGRLLVTTLSGGSP